ERLAEDFEDVAGELGELIEKQHAMMRQGDLAGAWGPASADERAVGNRMVGRPEGPANDKSLIGRHKSCDRMDRRRLEGLLEWEGREDARKSLRKHRLSCTGGADHDDVMAAGGSDLERALDGFLPFHFPEVGRLALIRGEELFTGDRERWNPEIAGEK